MNMRYKWCVEIIQQKYTTTTTTHRGWSWPKKTPIPALAPCLPFIQHAPSVYTMRKPSLSTLNLLLSTSLVSVVSFLELDGRASLSPSSSSDSLSCFRFWTGAEEGGRGLEGMMPPLFSTYNSKRVLSSDISFCRRFMEVFISRRVGLSLPPFWVSGMGVYHKLFC